MSFLAQTTNVPQQLSQPEAEKLSDYKEGVPLPDLRGYGELGLKWLCENTTPKLTPVGKTHNHYHANIAGLLCHGIIDWLGEVSVNGTVVKNLNWSRTAEDYYETTMDSDGGNTTVATTIRIYLGTETQTADSTLNSFHSGQTHPGYRGQAYVVLQNLYGGDGSFRVPDIKIKFRTTAPFVHSSTTYGGNDYNEGINPINHLVHLVTHPRAGLGLAQDDAFDMDDIVVKQLAYESEANTKYSHAQRGFISPRMTRNKKAKDWIKENLSYYDGFMHLENAKLTVDWFPNDTITEGSPSQFKTIYLADLVEDPDIDPPVWEKTISGVAIDYYSSDKQFRQTSLVIRSSHARQVLGEDRIETITRDWFTKEIQIRTYGERFISSAELPFFDGEIVIKKDRAIHPDNVNVDVALRGEPFSVGHLFKFNYVPYNLNVIVRVTDLTANESSVRIRFTQERGTYPLEYESTPDPIPDITPPTPSALDNWDIQNAAFGLTDERKNWVAVFAERFEGETISFDVTLNDSDTWVDEEAYVEEAQGFGVRTTVNEAVADEAGPTTFEVVANVNNFDLISILQSQDLKQQADNDLLLVVNGEWMSIGTVALISGTTYDVTCLRGILGTATGAHSLSDVAWIVRREDLTLWFHKKFDQVYDGNGDYDSGLATKYFKTLTRNIYQDGSWSSSQSLILADQLPSTPTGLTATAITEGVYFEFDAVESEGRIIYYEIENDDNDVPFSSPTIAKTGASGLVVSGISGGTTIYGRVRAIDSSGQSGAWSATANATALSAPTGSPGDDGLSVHVSTVFIRNATQPTKPTGGSYNFTSTLLTPPGGGWTESFPTSGTDPVWASTATWSIVGQTGTDSSTTWTDAFEVVEDGLSVHVSTIYKRDFSTPSTPTGGSFNFTNGTLTPPSGWSEEIPEGAEPLWSSIGRWEVVGSTGTDSSTTWTAPKKLSNPPMTAIPADFSPGLVGGEGDIQFVLNDLSGTPNDGELTHYGTKYADPEGNDRTITNNQTLNTQYESSFVGIFWIMYTNSDPTTRFGAGTWGTSTSFVPIVYEDGVGWRAEENDGTRHTFTPLSTDVIVAACQKTAATGGIEMLVPLYGFTGDTGNKILRVYKEDSTGVPATPTGGGTPSGWTVAKPGSGIIWQSESEQTYDDLLIGSWSTPVRTDGTSTLFQDKDTVVTSILIPGDTVFDSTENNRIYRWNGSTWDDVQKILELADFGTGLEPISIVSVLPTLPDTDYPNGSQVSLSTNDWKLYRNNAGTWELSVSTSDLSGFITTGQMQANTIDGDRILANTLTAGKIIAGTISATQLATTELLTVTAQIKDAIVTNAKISDLAAGKITAGTIAAQEIILSNSASSILRSSNYSAGVSGWQILGDGSAEFAEGTFRGDVKIEDATGNYKYHILGASALITFGLFDWDDCNIDIIARDNGGTSHEADLRSSVRSPDGTTYTAQGWQMETIVSNTRAYTRLQLDGAVGTGGTDLRQLFIQVGDSPSTGAVTANSYANFGGIPIIYRSDPIFNGPELYFDHTSDGGRIRVAKGGSFEAFTTIGQLHAGADGAELNMYDDHATTPVIMSKLYATTTGGRFNIYDDLGVNSVVLYAATYGGSLILRDNALNTRCDIYVSDTVGGVMRLYDASDRRQVQIQANTSGGLVSIYNDEATPELRGQLYVSGDDGRLILYDTANVLRIDLNPGTNSQGQAIIASSNYTSYSSANTDVTGLVSGSTFGTLIEGQASGHLVIGLRGNDGADGFSIIKDETSSVGLGSYDTLLFEVDSNVTNVYTNLIVRNHSFSIYNGSSVEVAKIDAGGWFWGIDANGYRITMDPANGFRTFNTSQVFQGGIDIAGHGDLQTLTFPEQATAPTAVSASGIIFFEDDGAGKTRAMIRFPTGADVQIGIEA